MLSPDSRFRPHGWLVARKVATDAGSHLDLRSRESICETHARVAELADAPDLGSGGENRGGSSPPFRTNHLCCLSTTIETAFHGETSMAAPNCFRKRGGRSSRAQAMH